MHPPSDIAQADDAVHPEVALGLAALAPLPIEALEAELPLRLPGWDLVWAPAEDPGEASAFVAFNGSQYVVALRGPAFAFDGEAFYDWILEGFGLFVQVPWPFVDAYEQDALLRSAAHEPARSEPPRISKGVWHGLEQLRALRSASGQSLAEFLMGYCVQRGRALAITGFSLGGGLAAPLGLWLRHAILEQEERVPEDFGVVTFGAPGVGNRTFADLFDRCFERSWRYFNALDIVPMVTTDAVSMASLFPAPAPGAGRAPLKAGVSLGRAFELLEGAILAADAFTAKYSFYSHTNITRGARVLNRQHQTFTVAATGAKAAWFAQAAAQHDPARYLAWLSSQA